MFALIKPIAIHVWGGLGSQLFAVALCLDLKEKFPSYQFILKLHSAGITSRFSEIDSIFPELDNLQISDFSVSDRRSNNHKKLLDKCYTYIFKITRIMAENIGTIGKCNTAEEFGRLKPWVISIRGHYAYRPISSSTLFYISNRVNSDETTNLNVESRDESLAIHYRLGDLLTVEEKQPINEERVGLEIQRLVRSHNPSKIICYSDSPEKASSLLQNFALGTPIESRNLPALSVIGEACKSKYFIGTNSKISFWIVCLRLFRSPLTHNSLPIGSKINWIDCVDQKLNYANIEQY